MTLASGIDADVIGRARHDVDFFAKVLVGEPLWRHQLDVLESKARTRCICSGRQAGKTRTLAIAALHDAYRAEDRRVLVISAGEDAAKNLLAEVSALASSPLLAGSVVDDSASKVTLTNGSSIVSVPASMKQIRGRAVDLLVLDEACFIAEEIWTAARYTMLARPGSRVLMASTPWSRQDRFFAVAWRAGRRDGLRRAEHGFESFHWPSTASPLVDKELLRQWRSTTTDREFRSEVLAEWVDDQGAFFTAAEISAAVADYELVPPSSRDAEQRPVVGGVDWGFSRDDNALVLIAEWDGDGAPRADGEPVYFLPWVESHSRMPYSEFVDRIVAAGGPRRFGERGVLSFGRLGYRLVRIVSEINGVGMPPTQLLAERLRAFGSDTAVVPRHTDNRSKQNAYGMAKVLLQQGRLLLPRHTGLLRQLESLEFEVTDSGTVKIAVPESAGHDDLASAFSLAVEGRPHVDGGVRLFPAPASAGNYAAQLLAGSR